MSDHTTFNSATLHRYFAWTFFKAIIYIIIFCALLVFLIDFTELLRRTASLPDVTTLQVLLLSFIRIPSIMEQILPFAVLIGSMGSLFTLSRRLELVVARGAGISVWQFLLPGFAVALGLGIFSTVAFNPGVNYLNDIARIKEGEVFKRDTKLLTGEKSAIWLRKAERSEDIILGAARTLNSGTHLIGVIIIRQSHQGKLIQRIDADEALLTGNEWVLINARITSSKKQKRVIDRYSLNLSLTADEVNEGFSKSAKRSFWSLLDLIKSAEAANLPTYRYSLQFNALLAQPFFFMAMMVIAATVSLRFIRSGSISGLIIAGMGAGFMLYIIRSLAEDLGGNGVVQPVLAAWLPTLLALVVGFTLLLHQEDG